MTSAPRSVFTPALLFIAAAGLAAFCCTAAPGAARAYDGLISGAPSGDGYDGLLAPSQPPRGQNNRTQEPPGYEGLIRGTVPQRLQEPAGTGNDGAAPERAPVVATPPTGTTPATRPGVRQPVQTARPDLPMTPRPGRVKVGPVSSAEQLVMLAALNGQRLDLSRVADGIQPSPALLGLKDPKQHRINGMLPMELMAQKQIEKVMASISHPSLTPAQKQANARNGYSHLMMLADGVASRRIVPDEVYRKMGMGDSFLAEEREAAEKALARFEAAFKVLRPLQ